MKTNEHSIDLVADVGEGFGRYRLVDDKEILDMISAANIACGFHAGDSRIMDEMVRACVEKDVQIGAHPSFRDLQGFGRRALIVEPDELEADLVYQIGALQAFAHRHGGNVDHVTLHGALGNMACERRDYAMAVIRAVRSCGPQMKIFAWAGELLQACIEESMPHIVLGFADRAYNEDRTLVARNKPGSIITDNEAVVDRVLQMARKGTVNSIDGKEIRVNCGAILLHGDTPEAVSLLKLLHNTLKDTQQNDRN